MSYIDYLPEDGNLIIAQALKQNTKALLHDYNLSTIGRLMEIMLRSRLTILILSGNIITNG